MIGLKYLSIYHIYGMEGKSEKFEEVIIILKEFIKVIHVNISLIY